MSDRGSVITAVPDVALKWDAWVDYKAPPRHQDTVVVYDDFVTTVTHQTVSNEVVFSSDAVSFSTGFTRSPTDGVTMGEALSSTTAFNRAMPDSVTALDSVNMQLGTTGNANYSDSVAATDLFGAGLSMVRGLADGMVTSDQIYWASTFSLNLADSATMFEASERDPYWPLVEALFHADGAQGVYNTTFIDSSPSARAVAIGGQLPFQGTVSPYPQSNVSGSMAYGNGSAWFGAVGTDWLYCNQSDDFHFPPGTDFTIELWCMITQNSPPDFNGDLTGCILSTFPQTGQTAGWTLNAQGSGGPNGPTGTGSFYMEIIAGSGAYEVVVAPPPAGGWPQNTWHHIAVCRVGTVTTIYVNGVNRNSYTLADQDLVATGPLVIGQSYASGISRIFKGFIADVRIMKGVAAYTANFTLPTVPTDGSTAATKLKMVFNKANVFDQSRHHDVHIDGVILYTGTGVFGQSSMSFDSGNRNIQTPFFLADRVAPMGQDFTAECWFWHSGATAIVDGDGNRNAVMLSTWPNGGPVTGWIVGILGDPTTTNNPMFAQIWNNGVGYGIAGPASVAKNVWHHVALSKIGQTMYLHLDGLLQNSGPAPAFIPPATPNAFSPLLVGMTPYPNYLRPFYGYIDEVRYTIGVGRYGNANYTRPTAPFPHGAVPAYTNRFARLSNDSVSAVDAPQVGPPPRTFTISPAVGGKTTWNLATDGPLNLTSAGVWTIVPTVTFVVHAKAWGASGASGDLGGCWSTGAGAITGDVTLTGGQSYTLTVGSGGKYNTTTAGIGGGGYSVFGGSANGGGGGGYCGITLGATDIFIAGASGGAGYGGQGGVGGGPNGGDGQDYASNGSNGRGGTPTAGGGPGSSNTGSTNPTAGAARQGGHAGGSYVGGGAGSGHFGGGGGGYLSGAPGAGGGGGGSSYADPTACPAPSYFAGSAAAPYNPGNSGDANWNGTAGKGVAVTVTNGADAQLRLA